MDKPRNSSAGFVRGLGLLGAVALVVGNMVGTSIYTLPASLAREVGPLALVGWAITAAGYLFVALVYARLGVRYPRTGGPYVYAREAFGDFAGFLVVWAYWFSATIGNAAIAVGIVGYAAHEWAALDASRWLQFGLAQALLWSLTLLNVLGVRKSGRVQIAVMLLNIVPLLVVAFLCLLHFDAHNLQPFAPHGLHSLPLAAALVVWAYSGIESATVPAEEVVAPERTIRRGTLIGYAIGTLVFLASALAVCGALPNADIAASTSPIAEAARRTIGSWAGVAVGIGAVIAGLGTLNGWILMSGRIPVAAAQDGVFFARLARIHPRFHTPVVALVVSSLIASLALCVRLSNEKDLLDTFDFVVGLSVMTTLLPHLFAAGAQLLLAMRDARAGRSGDVRRAAIVASVAFAFTLFTIYGCGAEVALWGFLVILAGIPLYAWFATRPRSVPGA